MRCNYSSCLLRSQKKSFACLTKGNVRTDMDSILILPSRTDGRRAGSTPRRRRDARQPAAPAAALAQRLRGVVDDGRSDCPAQTSAFSDAAMSWFACARLTSRDRLCGSALLSGCASLRIASEANLACASTAGELFSEQPIGLRSILRGGEIKYSALFCDAPNCFIFASATPTGAGTQPSRR